VKIKLRRAKSRGLNRWDGSRSVGSISLGMTHVELMSAVGERGEITDPDEEGGYFWSQRTPRLIVQVSSGLVVSISSNEEFSYLGLNLIGSNAKSLIAWLGGAIVVERAAGTSLVMYETARGVGVFSWDGLVSTIDISDHTLVGDD
jgi:hypothetical protein